MKATLLSTLTMVIMSTTAISQNVNIPDANFKAYLLGESTINTNSDTEIQVSEAIAFTGIMSPNYLGISDLTGIEAFVNMTGLFAEGNNLTSIDVSTCVNLERLTIQENNLSNLDLSNNVNLWLLYIGDNNISTIDLSTNTALEYLDCRNTNLTALDFSNNPNLIGLVCSDNNFSDLDLSQCPSLAQLIGTSTGLTSLNLKNVSTTAFLNVTNNPNLTCIEVDDVADAAANWTNIDATASFSLNCSTTGISEAEINQLVSTYPNPTNGAFTIDLGEQQDEVSIRLINSIGQIIQENQFELADKINLTINSQPGVYFLEGQINQNQKFRLSIIKQ